MRRCREPATYLRPSLSLNERTLKRIFPISSQGSVNLTPFCCARQKGTLRKRNKNARFTQVFEEIGNTLFTPSSDLGCKTRAGEIVPLVMIMASRLSFTAQIPKPPPPPKPVSIRDKKWLRSLALDYGYYGKEGTERRKEVYYRRDGRKKATFARTDSISQNASPSAIFQPLFFMLARVEGEHSKQETEIKEVRLRQAFFVFEVLHI